MKEKAIQESSDDEEFFKVKKNDNSTYDLLDSSKWKIPAEQVVSFTDAEVLDIFFRVDMRRLRKHC